MKAYLVADVAWKDEVARAKYAAVLSTLEKFGGRLLVAGSAVKVIEGEWKLDGLKIVEFPSRQAFNDWYHSEEYASLRELRMKYSETRLLVVDGVE